VHDFFHGGKIIWPFDGFDIEFAVIAF